jgi:hypothetical protein
MKTDCKKNKLCRICLFEKLKYIFSLNPTAPANAYRIKIDEKFKLYPLEIFFCSNCKHVQLSHTVNPKILFSNYLYTSSASEVYLKYLSNYANSIMKRYNLNANSDKICDIASNDGSFLSFFQKKNFYVQGIEPAKNLCKVSSKKNIKTLNIFLNYNEIKKYKNLNNKFKIVTANHVFAHVEKLNDFFKSVDYLLSSDGIFIFEVGYLYSVIQNLHFDTIYHEHLDYHHFHPLNILCKKNNYKVIFSELTKTQGGSIRIHCVKKNNNLIKTNYPSISKIKKLEKNMKLNYFNTYVNFEKNIKNNKSDFFRIAKKLNIFNKKIIGYGAPAKVTTFLSYYNFPLNSIKYIIDDSNYKQNLFLPSHNIKIKKFSKLKTTNFDIIIIFAWNFKESIIKKLLKVNKNFKIIIPFPKTKIINVKNEN